MITPQVALSHVALLIPATDKATAHLKKFKFDVGKDEVWVTSVPINAPLKNGGQAYIT